MMSGSARLSLGPRRAALRLMMFSTVRLEMREATPGAQVPNSRIRESGPG